MKRVKNLAKQFPDDPSVQDLVSRVRTALLGSKGGTVFEITPEMLAYRDAEQTARGTIAQAAHARWPQLVAQARQAAHIEQPFPSADPLRTADEDMLGSTVVLEDFRYPENQFLNAGRDHVFVGSQTGGYYFAQLDARPFRTAYQALRRYRDTISSEIPTPWTILGRVVGRNLMIPDASPEPKVSAEFGWVIDVEAILVPDTALVLAAKEGEMTGTLIGEEAARRKLEGAFTITEIPDKVSPPELLRIFATAIKEKNYALYEQCVHPSWLETPKSRARLRYYWENNQNRFHDWYVHVEPEEAFTIRILRGERIEDDEDFFLTEEDEQEILEHADTLLEQATVNVRRYNARGRQEGSPNPIRLRREGEGRWSVYMGFPL
ncbi:MAG: hypothetical protein AAFV53_37570 [Myxococcota bacterium]